MSRRHPTPSGEEWVEIEASRSYLATQRLFATLSTVCPHHLDRELSIFNVYRDAEGALSGLVCIGLGSNIRGLLSEPEKVRIRCRPRDCSLDEVIRIERLQPLLSWLANRPEGSRRWRLPTSELNELLRHPELWSTAMTRVGSVSW